jgi:hypothetical protein
MRMLVFALVVGLAAPALAATSLPEAPEVMAVVDAAAPTTELAAWSALAARFIPGTQLSLLDSVPTVLGKLVSAPRIDGVDLKKPLHLVVLNPQLFPQPVVLWLPVGDLKQLKASARTASLQVTAPAEGYVAVGSAAAVKATTTLVRRLPRASMPQKGIHAVAFIVPIWAAFGAQMTAAKALLAAQPPAGGLAVTSETMVKMADLFLGVAQQSERLEADVGVEQGSLQVQLALAAKTGSALDQTFAAQQPSDFALAAKLGHMPAPVLMLGRLDFPELKTWLVETLVGKQIASDPKELASVTELMTLLTGEFAMAGQMTAVDKVDYEYLLRVRDTKRLAALYDRFSESMIKAISSAVSVKVSRKKLPGIKYDGQDVRQALLHYDFSQMAGYKGKPQIDITNAWTVFDEFWATTMGTTAADRMRHLIDSARHGKQPLQLTPPARTSLERARAAKESLWAWLDFSLLGPAMGTPLPPWLTPAMTVGFEPHRAHLRLSLDAPGAP